MDLDFLDRPIAYHRVFVVLLGDHASAAFLSQCIYWSKRTKSRDGWFWKTAEQWYEEIVITRTQLDRITKSLEKLGLIQRRKNTLHGVINYRLCTEALSRWLDGDGQELTAQQIVDRFHFRLTAIGKAAHGRAFRQDSGKYVDLASLVLTRQQDKKVICACCHHPIHRGPSMSKYEGDDGLSLSFSYVTPLESGGSHSEENITLMHKSCVAASQAERITNAENILNNQHFADFQQSDQITDNPEFSLTNQDFADFQQSTLLKDSKVHCCFSANTYTEITSERERDSALVPEETQPTPAGTSHDADSFTAALSQAQSEYDTVQRNTVLTNVHSRMTVAPLPSTVKDEPSLNDLIGTAPPPQKPSQPALRPEQITMGQLARKHGLRCSASDPRLAELVEEGITIAEFREAIERSNRAKGPGGYELAYVIKTARNLHKELQHHAAMNEEGGEGADKSKPATATEKAHSKRSRSPAPAKRSIEQMLDDYPTDKDGDHVFRL